MANVSNSSDSTPPAAVLAEFYKNSFVTSLRGSSAGLRPPTRVQIVSMTDQAVKVKRAAGAAFDDVDYQDIRPHFGPDDLILAQHPSDPSSRYFLAKIVQKTTNEAQERETLNTFKVLWQGKDGKELPGFITRHDRKERREVIQRILPYKGPAILEKKERSDFVLGGITLVGYHLGN